MSGAVISRFQHSPIQLSRHSPDDFPNSVDDSRRRSVPEATGGLHSAPCKTPITAAQDALRFTWGRLVERGKPGCGRQRAPCLKPRVAESGSRGALATRPDGVGAVMLKEANRARDKKGGGYYRPGRNLARYVERISSL